jgi:hypothetical protein
VGRCLVAALTFSLGFESKTGRGERIRLPQLLPRFHEGLKKTVADLKGRVLLLEKKNKGLAAVIRRYQRKYPETPPEETKRVQPASGGVRSIQGRLRLSQFDFGKLLGTTAHSVYVREKKKGTLNLRDKTREANLSIRGLRAREAKTRLEEL